MHSAEPLRVQEFIEAWPLPFAYMHRSIGDRDGRPQVGQDPSTSLGCQRGVPIALSQVVILAPQWRHRR